MSRLDELTLKLLDASIDHNELRELVELCKDGHRETFLTLLELESHLLASGSDSLVDRVSDQLLKERCDRIETGVMQVVGIRESSAATVIDQRPSQLPFILASLVAVAACLAIAFVAVQPTIQNRNIIAQVLPHGSEIRIIDAEGRNRLIQTASQSFDLRLNETIETSQLSDSAEIIYADGTKLELLGETRVRLAETSNGSKQVTVMSGVVQADVTPQPDGQPLRIVTQSATLEVLGTTLGVEVQAASTQLGVARGRVVMTRTADGQRVEVEAGQFAMATESAKEPLKSFPFPELSSEWAEDFEDGFPQGWLTGELVEVDGEKCVRAIQSPHRQTSRFSVTSQNAWREGDHALCRVDEHSVLHLRFRQSEFGRMTIMIGTRSYPPTTGSVGANLFYTKKAWNENLPPHLWWTISIPLSDVSWHIRQGVKNGGAPAWDPLAAYLIHITTMERDAGLIIDRVWITNDQQGHMP